MVEPFYQDTLGNKIYNGHALEVLKILPDESVQMCMTSPPYWGLRDYAGGTDIIWGNENCEHQWGTELMGTRHDKIWASSSPIKNRPQEKQSEVIKGQFCSLCGDWRGQLGLEPTPQLYVEHLMMIFSEVKRVLRKEGSFWLNIGDTYASGQGSCFNPGGGEDSLEKARKEAGIYPLDRGNLSTLRESGLQPKCMTCIPERVMFAMIEDGWILRNKIIWHKPNSMPSSVKDRFTATWEYLYFFSKNDTAILWQNKETGEWRDTEPTREEKYPLGGRYRNLATGEVSWEKPARMKDWETLTPVWQGFDYYFDLDAVREPHKTQSLERYQSDSPSDLFGHGPQPQSFNLRVRDVKRGKGGSSAQSGELKASQDEIEEYEYPEKHHGLSSDGRGGLENLTKHDQAVNRTGDVSYTDPLHTRDYSPKGKNPGDVVDVEGASGSKYLDFDNPHSIRVQGGHTGDQIHPKGKNPGDIVEERTPRKNDGTGYGTDGTGVRDHKGNSLNHPLGKNPGDYWELTTQPYKGAHFAVYPEKLCIRPIRASSRIGDVVLDPFCGSGTTGVVAKRLGRKTILIDAVEKYCDIAKSRIAKVEFQPELKEKVDA